MNMLCEPVVVEQPALQLMNMLLEPELKLWPADLLMATL
jgi:hypothetical protein